MISVYFYHFLIENLPLINSFKVINIEKMLDYVISTIHQDKNKHNFKPETRHYVKGLFDLTANGETEHEYSYLALFKFMAATLLKTLFLTFKHKISGRDFKYLISVIQKVAQKINFENILLKNTLICLVHGVVFPKNPIPGWETFVSTAFTKQQKCEIVLALQLNDIIIQKECMNPIFKKYINQYFDIILQFIKHYQPLSK